MSDYTMNNLTETESLTFMEDDALTTNDIYMTIVFVNVIISAVIGLTGVVLNLINITVFIKMGFGEFTNVSLLSLAVADFWALLFLSGIVILYNPLMLQVADIGMIDTICYLAVATPHVCFLEISGCCNCLLVLERLLCIALPHRIKSLVTPRRALLVNISIYIYIISIKILVHIGYAVSNTVFQSEGNTTIVSDPQAIGKTMDSISNVLDTFTQLTTFPLMVGLTGATIRVFQKSSEWRRTVTSPAQSNAMSKKERKLAKMVLIISSVYLACIFPSFLTALIILVFDNLSMTSREVFFVTFTFLFNIDAINSTLPFFIYLNMSSKFKISFKSLFTSSLEGIASKSAFRPYRKE
ncbi:lysophosphatidic acid receptor 6 [Biomphalaria glabrata]|nr:lysophosphatidic acid receptor 6 [Biomphalaria glabrata]